MHGVRRFTFAVGSVSAILLVVQGCGNSTSVCGHVNFEGKAVANGSIIFMPADGLGPVAGGPITEGRYEVANISPGKKIAQISAAKAANRPASNEDRQRQAMERAKGGDTTGTAAKPDEIPPDAEGNNRQVDLAAGKQTLDFDLKARKK